MSAKLKNVEFNEELIDLNSMKSLQLCGENNRASGMSCPIFIETKMKKTKV